MHAEVFESGLIAAVADFLDCRDGSQGVADLEQFAGGCASGGDLADEAFQVADAAQHIAEVVALVGHAEEGLDDVQTAVDGLGVHQREQQPAVQQARPHGRDGLVKDAQEALAAFFKWLNQFQVAHGEAVEAHVAVLLDARNCRDVGQTRVLG